MAGDVGIHEQLVVHAEGAPDAAQAAGAVEAIGGGVTHQYGPRVLIAAIPPNAVPSLREQVSQAQVSADPAGLAEETTRGLDEMGALGLEAFSLRQSAEYGTVKAQRPLAGEAWDAAEAEPPDYHEEGPGTEAEVSAGASATSARLTGRVAVGLIIVEGPTADLKFSADERTKVVAEVQNGLTWLGSQSSPGGVAWVYETRVLTLNVAPDPDDTDDEKEPRWRDPAMAQLGYGAGMSGVQSFVDDLRSRLRTDWAYCALFTKYPLRHFAYASIGGPRLVMAYANDGWGPDNIDRVFAHETGHVFRAPDEYKASNCDCGGQWGHFNVPNKNCENCAPSGGVPCIMKSNDWAMCAYTPYHLGFPQGQRYSGVFLAGTEGHGLWVNADWQHFVAKWQQWSNQGLRLVDLKISEMGGQQRYSGVFRAGTDGYGLWVNADWQSFVAKWQEWSNQGLRLVDFEVAHIGGQPRYSGVFRAGTGGYGLWVNADWQSFVAKWQEWSNQGLRLVDLKIAPIGGQQRYSGVFGAGTGGHGLWVNADWSSFLNKWQEWSNQGLRLVDFEITTTGIEVAASQTALAGSTASDGAGHGFASVGGLRLSEAAQADETSPAGFGDASIGSTGGRQADETSPAGFGDASIGSTGGGQADETSPAGFGDVNVGGPAGGEGSGSGAGLGAAVP